MFATGEAAKVDDYLRNDLISDDFHHLARLERTRSALAGSPADRGRRRHRGARGVAAPRVAQFTPAEIHRLVALAELAAIALDNARLHALSEEGARAVEAAHQAAETQLGRVGPALGVQQELIEAIVDGSQLPGILRIVGERSGCQVALFDAELEHVACWPPGSDLQALGGAVREVQRCGGDDRQTHWKPCDGRVVAIHPVLAGREPIGFICLFGEEALDRDQAELTARQASLTVALNYLEEQAATKARASLREEILLHLLRGSSGERRAAIAPARFPAGRSARAAAGGGVRLRRPAGRGPRRGLRAEAARTGSARLRTMGRDDPG